MGRNKRKGLGGRFGSLSQKEKKKKKKGSCMNTKREHHKGCIVCKLLYVFGFFGGDSFRLDSYHLVAGGSTV